MHSLTSALDGDKWSALPPGIEPRYPLDRRQGVPQSRSGRGVEEKNSKPPPGIEPRPSYRPARSQSQLYKTYFVVVFMDASLDLSLWEENTDGNYLETECLRQYSNVTETN
jgi:hypothetical protein